MARLTLDISMSLDGFIAGPNRTVKEPLGVGGERLHEWIFGLASFRERHGMSGGERNADDEVVRETLDTAGAVLMGRRMFSGGEGPWEDDPVADGWWGDDPPFRVPVFVLTHYPRETVEKQGGTSFIFVTDGLESALAQAREAAGEKDVAVAGGANLVQQCLNAGLLDQTADPPRPRISRRGRQTVRSARRQAARSGSRESHSLPCGDPHQIPPPEMTRRVGEDGFVGEPVVPPRISRPRGRAPARPLAPARARRGG
jgi:dihydrofolate reductase